MKKICTLILALSLFSAAFAQLNNPSFETWTSFASGRYMQPNGWATPNPVLDVLVFDNNPLVTRVTPAQSGTYACQMKSDTKFSQFASGAVWLGVFALNLSDPASSQKPGIPYPFGTQRPARFQGWYKYTSVSGDSCDIYAYVSKWRGTRRDTLGIAKLPRATSTQTVGSFTQFDLPFNYTFTDIPDSIAIVCASSAGGNLLQGRVGSTLIVDNFNITFAS